MEQDIVTLYYSGELDVTDPQPINHSIYEDFHIIEQEPDQLSTLWIRRNNGTHFAVHLQTRQDAFDLAKSLRIPNYITSISAIHAVQSKLPDVLLGHTNDFMIILLAGHDEPPLPKNMLVSPTSLQTYIDLILHIQ